MPLLLTHTLFHTQELNKWRNSFELWQHASYTQPGDTIAYYNLACTLERVRQLGDENDRYVLIQSNVRHTFDQYVRSSGGNISDEKTDGEKWILLTLSLFDKAIELDVSYGAAYNNKGQLLEKIGQNKQAEVNYRMAIGLNNNTHYKAHNNLAQVMLNPPFLFTYPSLTRCLKTPLLLVVYDKLLHRQRSYEEAELYYRYALDIYPTYHMALFNLATLLHTTGHMRTRSSKKHMLLCQCLNISI